jgi:hypothetical protein
MFGGSPNSAKLVVAVIGLLCANWGEDCPRPPATDGKCISREERTTL